ncbi:MULTISPECIES: IncP-type conjugal transfer protein TrbI [Rhizobiaceae]|uniref:IncP-type conjugal transfer protein TrbI n=2 Tax=Rhizobium TaxID=379 RepID=A0A6P1C577_RHITR|nr:MULTISPECIES: IncP-type conjugal transfer protein TrbI [Rhizobiaceae]AEI89688.1 conjugal transfer trbI protein [Sinorhizobium fredii GR64]AGB73301.1 conjugal transfer protein TrbI [Rhizobium tropici CIAT 899]MBB4243593.1 type IV secretion system protein VirB10 [Rhizobium tropici]MBB5595501.1 type IV secretion system protein VirB10 [Rhizobium tropici]MBB6493951.1 type IV secretion system protein VirB10 [Rhizobium tropici]
MVQSLQLGTSSQADDQKGMRRLNRLPIILAIIIVALFVGVVVIGLSWRGLPFNRSSDLDSASNAPATNFGDQLKRGVTDGIIGDPEQREVFQPTPAVEQKVTKETAVVDRTPIQREERRPRLESEAEWKARLKREQDEQYIREAQRQRMARLQARATALDSPLKVDISDVEKAAKTTADTDAQTTTANSASDLYAAAMKSGLMGHNVDPNAQTSKEDFFNQDIKDLGYLPNRVVPQMSAYELKRGSVIPATLITGLNSDLPGRITAQVSQNVYDSATGYRLLIPQGAKLFGRYDSKVSFGQERVLVVWTDLIFPNGATLQIGGMAGTDAEGYGGFKDKVDRHLWRTWSSAALIALIGTGIDMSMPQSSTLATQETASDAARRNFAESFGRVAEQTISKNLNVQPTIQIRPGYKFNVLVDQDIIFPSTYSRN